ncbi:protease FtsH-inhibitory lysogeny factor CIII [Edwardsiella ictaluri]|nr:protease FtsH-inhibitory lysogeny factor CIII [Edwardsiella ictaluri]
MMNYAIAGGTFMGFAQHSQLSNIVENVKRAIKKLVDILNQKGDPL